MVDEDGKLGISTEFLKLWMEHNIALDTTGSYSSFCNHNEQQHKILTKLRKSLLYIRNLPNPYWCFALQYGVFILQRYVNYTNEFGKNPYKAQLWHSKIPDYSKLHLFGATCYVYDHPTHNMKHNYKWVKFVGYGNNTSHIIATPKLNPPLLLHSYNCSLATNCIRKLYVKLPFPLDVLIHKYWNNSKSSSVYKPNYKITISDLNSSFLPKDIYTYFVELPLSGPLGHSLVTMITTLIYLQSSICIKYLHSNFVVRRAIRYSFG